MNRAEDFPRFWKMQPPKLLAKTCTTCLKLDSSKDQKTRNKLTDNPPPPARMIIIKKNRETHIY